MREILGDNMGKFFRSISFKELPVMTFKNKEYEVWSVTDEDDFTMMCNMSEEEFEDIAGDEAWWRGSDGSNITNWETREFIVNNKKMIGYVVPHKTYYDYTINFSSLTEYLCEHIGASLPKNIISISMDLAKLNNITVGKLFSEYEGED